jgi:hypothetical protein
VVEKLLDRWDYLRGQRYRLRRRGYRDWILFFLVLGVALSLGVFAALAATRGFSDPTAADSRVVVRSEAGEVVTQTITQNGKIRRVVRYRTKAGGVSYRTLPGGERRVLLPGQTVHETRTDVATQTSVRTVTDVVTVVNTVVEIQPVTVTETVRETVTETVTETVITGAP